MLRGVLTRDALIAALQRTGGQTPVIDIMDRDVTAVPENACVENILRGIHDSLADRALNLLKRVGLDGEVTLIGGVARQAGMVAAVRGKLGVPVNVPAAPQYATALGAAVLGLSRHRKLAATAA